jgi:hypothetical protein
MVEIGLQCETGVKGKEIGQKIEELEKMMEE